MATVKQLLESKGSDVLSVDPDATVFEAIKTMADENVGALLVIDGGKPVGIFTERLYSRRVILKGRSSPMTEVKDVMDTPVISVGPAHTVDECMAIMTEHHVRHLPVLENDSLIGIVSIGDLVKSVIADQKFTIEQLETYIRG